MLKSRTLPARRTLDLVLQVIAEQPNLTEAEIRTALFGDPFARDINMTIRKLLKLGRIERHGRGGLLQPYRYTIRNRDAGTGEVRGSHQQTAQASNNA